MEETDWQISNLCFLSVSLFSADMTYVLKGTTKFIFLPTTRPQYLCTMIKRELFKYYSTNCCNTNMIETADLWGIKDRMLEWREQWLLDMAVLQKCISIISSQGPHLKVLHLTLGQALSRNQSEIKRGSVEWVCLTYSAEKLRWAFSENSC